MAENMICPECQVQNVKAIVDIQDPGYKTQVLYQCRECKNIWGEK
ncbi:hypothetical protein [Methanolobus sp. ZRKC5]